MMLGELATQLGVSHAFLSQIRNGKLPLPEALKAKAEVLGAYQLLTNDKQSVVVRVERVMGLEPTTACLGSKNSTTELHPPDEIVEPAYQGVNCTAHVRTWS